MKIHIVSFAGPNCPFGHQELGMAEDATVKDAIDTFRQNRNIHRRDRVMVLGIVKQSEMYNRNSFLLSREGMDTTKRIVDILPLEYALVVGTVSRVESLLVLSPSLFKTFIIFVFFRVTFDPEERYYRPAGWVFLTEVALMIASTSQQYSHVPFYILRESDRLLSALIGIAVCAHAIARSDYYGGYYGYSYY